VQDQREYRRLICLQPDYRQTQKLRNVAVCEWYICAGHKNRQALRKERFMSQNLAVPKNCSIYKYQSEIYILSDKISTHLRYYIIQITAIMHKRLFSIIPAPVQNLLLSRIYLYGQPCCDSSKKAAERFFRQTVKREAPFPGLLQGRSLFPARLLN